MRLFDGIVRSDSDRRTDEVFCACDRRVSSCTLRVERSRITRAPFIPGKRIRRRYFGMRTELVMLDRRDEATVVMIIGGPKGGKTGQAKRIERRFGNPFPPDPSPNHSLTLRLDRYDAGGSRF